MVEPEIAFADLNDNIELADTFLKFVFNRVLKSVKMIWHSSKNELILNV